MSTELRRTGISVIGDVSWGTHFCHFYETKQDLLDTLVPYFKAGLETNEYCLWVVSDSELITVEEAKKALSQAVPDLDRHLSDENIEIVNGHDWYFENNVLSLDSVTSAWNAKVKRALARGYDGLRASADTFWLAEKDLQDFCHYEKQVDNWITDQAMTVMCTYPLRKSGASEIFDVLQVHQFTTARRQGEWQVIQTPELITAKAEIRRLNDELQRRVKGTPQPPFILRYGVAVLAVAAALTINRLLNINLVGAPAMLFLCAVMFSAWYGGVKPGLLALPLAIVAFAYYFVTPINSWSVDPREIPRLSLFVMACLFVILLSAAQRRAAESLSQARDVLAGTVEELKQTNQALRTENTERKRAEEELKKEKEILEKIFENIPVMIGFVGDDGVKLVNPEWERTIGWTLKELQEQNVNIFVEAYPDPQYRQQVLDFVAASTGEWVDLKIKVRDGRVIDAACAVVHLSNGTRVAIAQDITERKQAEEALNESQRKLEEAQRIAHVGHWERDLQTGLITWSDEIYRILGLPLQEPRTEWQDLLHPQDREKISLLIEEAQQGIRRYDVEYRIVRPDGEVRFLHSQGDIIRDEEGQPRRAFGVAQDITERKRAEAALDERLRFETMLTELSAAFANLSPNEVDHEIDKWLQTLVEFLGVDRASFLQFEEDWTTVLRTHSYTVPGIEPLPPPPIRLNVQFPWITDQLRRGITEKWSRVPDDMAAEAVKEREYAAKLGVKSGLNIPVRVGGSIIGAITFTSITSYREWPDSMVARLRLVGEIFAAGVERKRAEEHLKATGEQLRALSGRVQAAREEEATRIAREIHDELGGALTSLKWDLEDIDAPVLETEDRSDLQAKREKIGSMVRLIDATINTVRRIASELRPIGLDDLGLVAAIELHARKFQDRTGIIVECDCALQNLKLSQDQSTAIFRIFQEALTNILRHARATRVTIQTTEEAGEFTLTIVDNGRGITDDERSGKHTLGLLGMRERAHLIGGTIDITGSAGKGTVVTLRISKPGQA